MFLRYGYISEYDPATGFVRVELDEDTDVPDGGDERKIVTNWIPVIVKFAKDDKETFPFDITAHVACIMDEYDDDGVCIGAIYDAKNKPNGGGNDIHRIRYKDGSIIEFNRSTGKYKIDVKGDVEVKAGGDIVFDASGDTTFNGGNNNGIPKVQQVVSADNAMQQDINMLKNIFIAWVTVPNDGGAALKALAATWASQPLSITTVSSTENNRVKH